MRKLLYLVAATVFLAGCWLPAQNPAVTDVEGESWVSHLARSFNETSMGKTGRLGPAPTPAGAEANPSESEISLLLAPGSVALHGSDLYRLNCQGCHGESGLGAPPEINSLINPVRATSTPLVMERMKRVGMDISPANAAEMARQSRKALLQRLHQGGEDMPPFQHLSEPEIRALVAYLNRLAGVSSADSIRRSQNRGSASASISQNQPAYLSRRGRSESYSGTNAARRHSATQHAYSAKEASRVRGQSHQWRTCIDGDTASAVSRQNAGLWLFDRGRSSGRLPVLDAPSTPSSSDCKHISYSRVALAAEWNRAQ